MAAVTFTVQADKASDLVLGTSPKARDKVQRVQAFLAGVASGAYGATSLEVGGLSASATVTLVDATGDNASGTVTLGGGAGNVTIVVGGTSVGPVTFNTSDAQTALDCITALNNNVTVAALVTASSGGSGVVLIAADTKGTVGNSITLTASRTAGTATASGATLAGGTNNAVVVTINGVAINTNTTTAADDAAATLLVIDAVNASVSPLVAGLVTASLNAEDATTLDVTADSPGPAGNQTTIAASQTIGTPVVSTSRLTGGTSTTYTF